VIVTIHQPEHLPWLGLIEKISKADLFVILDTVQYQKNYFHNRNKIRTSNEFAWITVPVKKFSHNNSIREIQISYDQKWELRYLNLIKTFYSKTAYFDKYFPLLESEVLKKHEYLVGLNCAFLSLLTRAFEIDTKIVKASDLELPSNLKGGTIVNYEICKSLSAKEYLSGISGKDYLDSSYFNDRGIQVKFQEFYHPIYQQRYEPFLPFMSSIDSLFLYGDDAKTILFSDKTERLSYYIT
jgi:hypothetical protein